MKVQHPFEITSNTGTSRHYGANAQEARKAARAAGIRGISSTRMIEGLKAQRPMPPIRPRKEPPPRRPRSGSRFWTPSAQRPGALRTSHSARSR